MSAVQQALFGALRLPELTAPVPEVDDLVDRLARATIGTTCNFYSDDVDGAVGRRDRLRRYLAARWSAPVLLVGEAAGYQGARLSGIAFTSQAQLGMGPSREPSASVVHRVLAELGAEDDVLLWNVVPTHPHLPGKPQSNRAPTRAEVEVGAGFLAELTVGRAVVAVGRVAAAATGAPYVRHPAHGGARAFATGMGELLSPLVGGTGTDRRT